MPVKKTTIVAADDDPQLLRLVTRNLEFEEYEVLPASDGQQALEQVEAHSPDLVLLDVMMPGRDGWQVCRDIKSHPTLGRNVRVVMVTALDDWVNKRQALQTGADDFVEKPFELSKLAATVERNVKQLASNTPAASTSAPTG